MSGNKKGARKSEPFVAGDTEHKYNEGDIVLGKIKGYPAWPGKVVNADSVPPRVQKDKPKKKKDVYAIRFYPTGEYMWANTKEMSTLTKNEITKYLDDSSKKREGDLRKGYQVALDPAEWEEEHDRRLADAQAQQDDELDDDEETGSKRRSKTTAKGAAKKAKTEPRKSRAKKADDSDVEEEKDEPTKVKSWRHELQRIFLGFEPAKPEAMPKADIQYNMIEAESDVSVESITTSKINKVLKRIIGLENIPEDEQYKIRERSQVLYDKFEKILATNGEGEKKDDEEKKEENGTEKKEENGEEKKDDAEKKDDDEKKDEQADGSADKPAEEENKHDEKKEEAEKPADEPSKDAEKAEKAPENGSAPQ